MHLKPETELRLQELAATTGPAQDDLLEGAMAGYLTELGHVRGMPGARYDDVKSGRVKPIEREEAFNRQRRSNSRV